MIRIIELCDYERDLESGCRGSELLSAMMKENSDDAIMTCDIVVTCHWRKEEISL